MTDVQMTNRQVEDIAIRLVLEREHTAGRAAVDTRGRGALADIEGNWLIEAKAFGRSARGADLWLETRQVHAALAEPDRFHLVLVENIRSAEPRIIDIHAEQLVQLLDRRREKHYFEAPFPTGVMTPSCMSDARRLGSEIPQGFRRRSVRGQNQPTSPNRQNRRFRRSDRVFRS